METSIPRTEKRCPRCETVKPASAFHKSHSSYDGLSGYCKSCTWQHKTRDRNPAPEGQKRCSSCQTVKPFDQFFNDNKTKDGYGYECKPCHKERQKQLVSLLEPTGERLNTKKGIVYRSRPKENLPEGYKRCLKCDEVKPFDAFYKRLRGQFGLDSYCKPCNKNRPQLPVLMPEEKFCPKCEQTKPAIEFYVDRGLRSKDGLHSCCRECAKVGALSRVVTYSYRKKRSGDLQKYGLTIEEYERILLEQDGKCASCGKPETTIMRGKVVPLAVDHCHVTGAIRGLLCRRCNQALGMLCDDPERIEALLKYALERVLY